MPSCIVVFASLNQVALLKRSLIRQGVFVDMLRTPHCLSSTGCSFALRCERRQIVAIEEACGKLAISPGGTFKESVHDGGVEYRPLRAQL